MLLIRFILPAFLCILCFNFRVFAESTAGNSVELRSLSSDEIRTAFKQLVARDEQTRNAALDLLVHADADLSALLVRELDSANEVRIKAALAVIEAQPRYLGLMDVSRMLASDNGDIAELARRCIRAGGTEVIFNALKDHAEKTGPSDARDRAGRMLAYELRYATAHAVAHATMFPGTSEQLMQAFPTPSPEVLGCLEELVMGAEPSADATSEALTDIYEQTAAQEGIAYAERALLRTGSGIKSVFSAMRKGAVTPDAFTSRLELDGAFRLFARLRRTATQTLAHFPVGADALGVLLAIRERELQRGATPYVGTDMDVVKEAEVSLAHLGQDAFVLARIADLRKRAEGTATAPESLIESGASAPQIKPDIFAHDEVAYLLLRIGKTAEAAKEYPMVIRTLERDNPQLNSYALQRAHYNLACALSRENDADAALEQLKLAVARGYTQFGWILRDEDLALARTSAAFAEWFEGAAPPYLVREFHEAAKE